MSSLIDEDENKEEEGDEEEEGEVVEANKAANKEGCTLFDKIYNGYIIVLICLLGRRVNNRRGRLKKLVVFHQLCL